MYMYMYIIIHEYYVSQLTNALTVAISSLRQSILSW